MAEAAAGDDAARGTFEALSPSNTGWHVSSIEGEKSAETRTRRIEKSVAAPARGPQR